MINFKSKQRSLKSQDKKRKQENSNLLQDKLVEDPRLSDRRNCSDICKSTFNINILYFSIKYIKLKFHFFTAIFY